MILTYLEARNSIPELPRARDPEARSLCSALLSTPFHLKSPDLGLPHSTVEKLTPFRGQKNSTVRLPPLRSGNPQFPPRPLSPSLEPHQPHPFLCPTVTLPEITCPRGGSAPAWGVSCVTQLPISPFWLPPQ